MLYHATAKNGVLKLIGTLPKEVRHTRPILPQRYPLRGAGNQRTEQVKKRKKKRQFCSMGSGKPIFWGIFEQIRKVTIAPPYPRGAVLTSKGSETPYDTHRETPQFRTRKARENVRARHLAGFSSVRKRKFFPEEIQERKNLPPYPPIEYRRIGCFPLISAVFTESPIWGGNRQDSRFVSTLFPKPLARGLRAVPSFGRLHGLAVLPVWIILSRKPISSRGHKAVSPTLSTQSV